jgi:hypothetical protein
LRIDCALLCDAATVREGLLHILGGGVTRAGRTEYPAPLNLALALRILVHPTEADHPHNLEVRLQGADGDLVANLGVEFGVSDMTALAPGEHASIPLPIAFPEAVVLPGPDNYSFELLIDGTHQVAVPFIATQIEVPPEALPPGQGGEE